MPAVNEARATGAAGANRSRRERARETRLRMIRAAHELFTERGYTGARMADIAARAGVAVQTVYFTFHTKAELLRACYERAVLGEDDPRPPQAQPWFAEMLAARSGAAALRHFATGNTEIVSRVGRLDDVARSASHEPDAVAVRAHSEQLRRAGYRAIIEHLQTKFGLAAGLDVETATDLLLTLGGTGIYGSLVLDYGWTLTRFVDWLSNTLAEQLGGGAGPGGSSESG